MGKMKELIEEYTNLMQAGYDELAVDDRSNAREYFADAGHLLSQITDETLKEELSQMYSVNPLDYI